MKKKTSYSIAILVVIIGMTYFLKDDNFFNTVFLKLQSHAASSIVQKKVQEQYVSIDPELLALPACDIPENIIQHTGFSLLYSPDHEQAAWVAYVLTSKEVNGSTPRSNNFKEDPSIITGSAGLYWA